VKRQHQIELQIVAACRCWLSDPAQKLEILRDYALSGPPLDELNLRMIGSIEADITGLGFLNIGDGKET
jgi:hypothetical protein